MGVFNTESPQRAALFTTFLNPKGRLLFDAIIVKPMLADQNETPDGTEEIEFWIDVEENDAQSLVKHLKRYALRNRSLSIEDISHVIKPFSL